MTPLSLGFLCAILNKVRKPCNKRRLIWTTIIYQYDIPIVDAFTRAGLRGKRNFTILRTHSPGIVRAMRRTQDPPVAYQRTSAAPRFFLVRIAVVTQQRLAKQHAAILLFFSTAYTFLNPDKACPTTFPSHGDHVRIPRFLFLIFFFSLFLSLNI